MQGKINGELDMTDFENPHVRLFPGLFPGFQLSIPLIVSVYTLGYCEADVALVITLPSPLSSWLLYFSIYIP